jgi:putative nucleotidyltransferase with HDIG domain
MGTNQIENVVSQIKKLPTLPTVANKVNNLIQDPTCTAIKLSEVLDKDQSLTTRVLRLVNSAFYSLSAEVSNVRHAIALLGFKTISQMVISICVFDVFKGKYADDFDRKGFWKHSIACAVISKLIGEKCGYGKGDECFTAGLLHDIGKVVLDQYLHDMMLAVLQRTREKNITFVNAEQEVLGLNHTDIGGQVMTNWNIPIPVVVAVKHHHQKVEERKGSDFAQDLIVDIVRLSDVICKYEGIGYNGDTVETELTDDLWERLSLDSGAIKRIIAASKEEIEKASILMDLT